MRFRRGRIRKRAATAIGLVVALLLFLPALLPNSGGGLATSLQPYPPPGRSLVAPFAISSALAPARPSVAGGEARLIVNSTDSALVPNSGLQVNLTGYSSFAPLPANSSFQAAGEEAVGNYSAVFGIFQNNIVAPEAIFFVFSNITNQVVSQRFWSALSIVPNTPYDFEFQQYSGTIWELTVNGHPFGGNLTTATFDFRAQESTWAARVLFSEVAFYSTASPVPQLLSVPLALAVRLSSGWYLPNNGWAYYNGSLFAGWGVQGRVQHGSLAPGELETGLSVPSGGVSTPTQLWNGSRIPVSVSVAVNPVAGSALETAQASVLVTGAGGAPIPGVAVYLSDAGGALFTPSTVTTNGSGAGFGYFITPNVSQSSFDLVSGVVTLFGYEGFASNSIFLTPAQQILVIAASDSPTAAPGENLTLQFATRNAGGGPQGNILLTFEVFGEGVLSSSQGLSDSTGHVSVSFEAPLVAATATVLAVVSSQGAWGRSSVTVHVQEPTPSFWSTYGIYLLFGALAGLLAAVVYLAIRRSRRGRKPMPELPLREYLRAKRLAESLRTWRRPAEPEDSKSPPSRTPPESGNP